MRYQFYAHLSDIKKPYSINEHHSRLTKYQLFNLIDLYINKSDFDCLCIRPSNIQNPCPVGDKTDTINLHRDDEE